MDAQKSGHSSSLFSLSCSMESLTKKPHIHDTYLVIFSYNSNGALIVELISINLIFLSCASYSLMGFFPSFTVSHVSNEFETRGNPY